MFAYSRRLFIAAIPIMLLILITTSIAGAQHIVPEPIPPEPHPLIQRDLTLTDMRVDISIDGSVAHTTIRQTLRNDGDFVAEGQYMLPLPFGASVSDFAIIDGDNRLEPEVLPADEARKIYQDIVRQMRDPGLLEYQDSHTFRVSVFPFQPGQSRTIEVKFTQALAGTTSLVTYNLPLRWAGWSRCYGTNFVLSYDIESAHDLGTISSPTHGVSVHREGDRSASGSYEATVDDFGSDFILNIGRRTGDFAASLMCFPGDKGEDGYFLLSLLAAMPKDNKYVPKDIVFIFDKSGSMSGEKIEQAKGALKFIIDKLKGKDRFNLIYYSDFVESLYDELMPANADNIREARDFASRLEADGSTDIDSALSLGARMLDSNERPTYAIFLTDGLPTAGEQDIDRIIENARDHFDDNVKLFVFGVGYDVNTTLLDSLSYNHHGTASYVTPDEDIEAEVSNFYAKMSSPALVDLDIELGGLDEYNVMPKQLPDLFHNSEIFITGRYRGCPTGDIDVTVRGKTTGGKQTKQATVEANVSSRNHQVARLWATRRVSYLLDQIRLHGDDKELLDEVDRLAMRYGIVTPYTSYLITEPDIYFDAIARGEDLAMEMEEARVDESGATAVGRSKMNQANVAAGTAAAPQQAGAVAGKGRADDDIYMDRAYVQYSPSWFGFYTSADPNSTVNYVNNQTFVMQVDEDAQRAKWVDARYIEDEQDVVQLTAYGDEYFDLLNDYPELGDYLSQGTEVMLVIDKNLVLQTTPDEVTNSAKDLQRVRDALDSGDYLSAVDDGKRIASALGGSSSNGPHLGGLAALGSVVLAGSGVFALGKIAGNHEQNKEGESQIV